MTPLRITATLGSAVAIPWHPISLDSLLVAAAATRDNLPPLAFIPRNEWPVIGIPIAKERGIYLCSVGISEREAHEQRWMNRRFPVTEAQMLGDGTIKRINMSAGACKSYRLPLETSHMKSDTMTWFASGDRAGVEELLSWVLYLGKKRSVGLGKVVSWCVDDVAAWDGFPVLRDGAPLRSLPLDWPGLGEYRRDFRVLSPPYWERWREEECAVPT